MTDLDEVAVYDAGEDYGDRFTAVFPDGEMLGIGASGNVPNGFCMHVGNVTDPAYRDGMNLGDPVRFADLPEPVRRAIARGARAGRGVARRPYAVRRRRSNPNAIGGTMQYVVKAQNLDDLDDFTRAYLEAAEWSGLDEEDMAALAVDPTWDAASIERAVADCTAFRGAAADLLDGIDAGQAGHDFWLTRNRHGTGFWDRELGAVGDALTVAAHGYGETGVWFDADTETLSLDGTYTDLPAGAGDTVIHVPEDPDGIVLQESLQPNGERSGRRRRGLVRNV